jgi:hypothetical protein
MSKSGEDNLRIDFLATVYGLDTEQIASTALPFNSTKLPGISIKVLNPILCLAGKLKAYTGLPQYGRQDKKHLEIAILVARQFIQEFCVQNKPRQGLQLIEKLVKIAKSEAGLKVWQQDDIDILQAVSIDSVDSFAGEQWQKFRELRLLQLLKEVADKRSKYAQIVEHQLERKRQIQPEKDFER